MISPAMNSSPASVTAATTGSPPREREPGERGVVDLDRPGAVALRLEPHRRARRRPPSATARHCITACASGLTSAPSSTGRPSRCAGPPTATARSRRRRAARTATVAIAGDRAQRAGGDRVEQPAQRRRAERLEADLAGTAGRASAAASARVLGQRQHRRLLQQHVAPGGAGRPGRSAGGCAAACRSPPRRAARSASSSRWSVKTGTPCGSGAIGVDRRRIGDADQRSATGRVQRARSAAGASGRARWPRSAPTRGAVTVAAPARVRLDAVLGRAR